MNLKINLELVDCEYRLENSLEPQADLKINAAIVEYKSNFYCAYRTDFLDDFAPKNYITLFDKRFNPLSHIALHPENGNEAFEDIRLFVYRDRLLAIYTYLPKLDTGWLWENGIAIAEVDLVNGLLIKQQSLRHLALGKHEKNYVPLVHNNELFIITNIEPDLRIIRANGNVGDFIFEEIVNKKTDLQCWRFGQLRGGTPFIPSPDKKDTWQYSFIHSSVYLPNGNFKSRYYFYTLMRIDPNTFKMEYVSNPIGYSKNEVESKNGSQWILKSKKNYSIKVAFPMGIISQDTGIYLSYGKDDCVSRMKFYSWDYVKRCFDNYQSNIEIKFM
jgi:hypothetical protein